MDFQNSLFTNTYSYSRLQSGKLDVNEDDPFDLFVTSTNIRYAYYHETHKILGKT